MKTIKDILRGIDIIEVVGDLAVPVTGIQFDSRKVKAGELFVAVKGTHVEIGRASCRERV